MHCAWLSGLLLVLAASPAAGAELKGTRQRSPDIRYRTKADFSPAELGRMKADWKRVLANEGDWTPQKFYDKYRLHNAAIASLRRQHPDDFKPARGGRTTAFRPTPALLSQLQNDWSAQVMTGQQSVPAFLKAHGLSKDNLHTIRESHPDLLPPAPTRIARPVSEDTMKRAEELNSSYLAGRLTLDELMTRLAEVGMGAKQFYRLKKQGHFPSRRDSPAVAEARRKEIDPLVSSVLRIARRSPWVIKKHGDLYQLLNEDQGFVEKFGKVSPARFMTLRTSALRRGDSRLEDLLSNELNIRKYRAPRVLSRVAGSGKPDEQPPAAVQPPAGRGVTERDLARALAEELEGREPTRENWNAALERLGRRFPGRGPEQKWHSLRAQYQTVLPELARWQLRPDRPFSLRTMARWMEIESQAGPGASWQEKVAAYQRSPEFQQDGRIPSRSAVAQWRSQFRELLTSPRERGYHKTRSGESPEAIDARLVRDILATPTIPPLLRTALDRLDGRLPFKYHNVMFINHRYSDIVPFTETMIGAGMVAQNAVFVSTPYPFNSAVDLQLRQLGLKTRVPKLSMKDYARQVEAGIRDMLKLHEKNGRTILILDDGGMASKIIAEKFQEHVGKFKIVEITAAGHRLAGEFKARYQRLPFVYYSIAYTDLKREVTSKFFGTRVVDRTLNLIEQSRLPLRNKEAVVIGGGPMGQFAGERLRALGFQVTFVEPDALRADLLRRRYKTRPFKVAPIEEALRGKSLILGMSGYQTLRPEHIQLIEPDAVIAQGSSKRNEFDMTGISRLASHKQLIPRTDGLAQKSYSYTFGKGSARKRLHFLGDGWTINHDGSLHGTPIEDIQLELAVIFESAAQAAQLRASQTGEFREVGGDIQRFYLSEWQRLKRQKN